jgi:hypothetical protein
MNSILIALLTAWKLSKKILEILTQISISKKLTMSMRTFESSPFLFFINFDVLLNLENFLLKSYIGFKYFY